MCLPLLLGTAVLLTLGGAPVCAHVPTQFHLPLMAAMLGGPSLAVALCGALAAWRSRAMPRIEVQGAERTSGNSALGWLPATVTLMSIGALSCVALLLFVHFIAG